MEIKSVWSLEENDSGKRRRKENVALPRLHPESRERSRVTSTAELPIYRRDRSEGLSYAAFLPPVSPCILGCRALMQSLPSDPGSSGRSRSFRGSGQHWLSQILVQAWLSSPRKVSSKRPWPRPGRKAGRAE